MKRLHSSRNSGGDIMNVGKEIFNTIGMAQSIRYTDYKDIYSAISELVDNSIEAEAKHITICIYESLDNDGKKRIGDIGILDDGIGMEQELLHECLVFGSSTKKDRKSMGRFGVGLGQASLFAAPRVEVYSWQSKDNVFQVYLDTDLMSAGKQEYIYTPKKVEFPRLFSGLLVLNYPPYVKMDYRECGTFVLWKNVDKVNGRINTFIDKLSIELGRKFRYYIDKGVKINITTTSLSPFENVQAVDPMFLMEKAKYLAKVDGHMEVCDSNYLNSEPIFEPFMSELTPNGEYIIPVRIDKENKVPIISRIKVKVSIVKSQYYYSNKLLSRNEKTSKSTLTKPGETEIGKVLKQYERISIVRSNREIDFDRFNLYESVNDPANRFWSLEISFDPILDEFFRLSNNKQKVEILAVGKKKGSSSLLEEVVYTYGYKKNEIIKDVSEHMECDDEMRIWIHLNTAVSKLIKLMKSRNSEIYSSFKEHNAPLINIASVSSSDDHRIDGKADVKPYVDVEKIRIDDFADLKAAFISDKKQNKSTLSLEEFVPREVVFTISSSKDDLLFNIWKKERTLFCGINWDHEIIKRALIDPSEDSVKQIIMIFLGNIAKTKNRFKTLSDETSYSRFIEELNNAFIRKNETEE